MSCRQNYNLQQPSQTVIFDIMPSMFIFHCHDTAHSGIHSTMGGGSQDMCTGLTPASYLFRLSALRILFVTI